MSRNIREEWDEEMVARAAGMKRAGFANAEIAKRLGVTENAVRYKLYSIKAKRRLDGSGGKWTNGLGRHLFESMEAIRQTDEELGTPSGMED
jgi:Zn-dependent peptidase ImmA (M78 family)